MSKLLIDEPPLSDLEKESRADQDNLDDLSDSGATVMGNIEDTFREKGFSCASVSCDEEGHEHKHTFSREDIKIIIITDKDDAVVFVDTE